MPAQDSSSLVHQTNDLKNGLKSDQVAIVMVPWPFHSHITMLLNLSHLFASSYTDKNISIHVAGSTISFHKAKLRHHGNPSSTTNPIHFHDLSPESHPNVDPSSSFNALVSIVSDLRQPAFRFLQDIATKYRRVVVIYDYLTSSVVQDVPLIPNVEAYSFDFSPAFSVFYDSWKALDDEEKPFELDPEIDQVVKGNLFGGLSPFSRVAEFIAQQHKLSAEFESGILYNTSRVIEGTFIESLEKINPKTNHFALGPFNLVEVNSKVMKSKGERHRCLQWLDKQEGHSVIYVSFGTTSLMGQDQIRELAIGLERSGQKFIWVLIETPDVNATGVNTMASVQDVLPEGYEERLNDRGIIVKDWAPQPEILAHPSTGGFMSHCGWGSCLESISMGVPIAAWPMHSDQPRHAVLVTDVLKIGVPVRDWRKLGEVVTSSMVEIAVRRLMTDEGEEIRKRATELGVVVRGTLEPGGASRLEMDSFIAHVTRCD